MSLIDDDPLCCVQCSEACVCCIRRYTVRRSRRPTWAIPAAVARGQLFFPPQLHSTNCLQLLFADALFVRSLFTSKPTLQFLSLSLVSTRMTRWTLSITSPSPWATTTTSCSPHLFLSTFFSFFFIGRVFFFVLFTFFWRISIKFQVYQSLYSWQSYKAGMTLTTS